MRYSNEPIGEGVPGTEMEPSDLRDDMLVRIWVAEAGRYDFKSYGPLGVEAVQDCRVIFNDKQHAYLWLQRLGLWYPMLTPAYVGVYWGDVERIEVFREHQQIIRQPW